jgi:hypothetical protein
VRIDLARIPGAETIALPTFDTDTLRLIRDRVTELSGEAIYWYGHVQGEPGSSVTMVLKGEVLIGNIRAGRRSFEIRYLGSGVHRLAQVDPNRYPAEGEPTLPTDLPEPEADACATDPPTDIDVLTVYTDDARAGAGGTDAIEATVLLAVEETNQSYINSNVTQRIRLAHMAEVVYAESGNSMTDRDRLRNTSDGILDNIHTLRDTHGADLVIMITESLENCGRAYIMNPVSTAFETSGFGVTRRSCAVGNYSYGHELGHIMGARHDWVADNTNNSPYVFNHGHVVTTPTDPMLAAWRTIMALPGSCASCGRVIFWANPFVDFPVGGTMTDPMGTATGTQQTDNHQTLENTAGTVANFRCSSPGTSNVWMKDTWNDTGREPDPATAGEAMWRSPYIWVRNSQDVALIHQHQHQDPEFGSTNWIYVKLHNAATTAQSGTLELYYANASTSLTWPGSWTLIGSVPVSGLVAHGTRVVEQQWTSLPGEGHFCLLARWVSSADPMATAEGPDIGANVRANNNLVWRNLEIVDLTSDAVEEDWVIVRNSDRKRSLPITLRIGWRPDERRPSFLPVGEVVVSLDTLLMEAWNRGGRQGSGYEPDQQGLRIGRAGAELDQLLLPPGGEGRLFVRMRRLPSTPRRAYWLEVVQLVRDTVIGGVTYEVRTDRVP